MRKRLTAILTAAVLAWTAVGAAAAMPAAQVTRRDLKAINGENLAVFEEDGRITFVGGACMDEPVKGQEEAAEVVRTMISLLGGDESTRFEPLRVLKDPAGNVYYVFQQMLQDRLVQGGAVKVVTDSAGNMTGLTGSVIAEPAGSAAEEGGSSLTAEQAEAVVLRHEKETGNSEPATVKGHTGQIVLPVERELDAEAESIEYRCVWVVYTTNPRTGGEDTALPYLAHYVTLDGEYLYSLQTIIPGDTAGSAGYDASYVFEFMEPAEYTGYVELSDGTEQEVSVTLMRDSRTGMYYLGNIEHRIVVADCWEFLYNGGRVVLEYSPDNMEWDQTGLLSLYNYCRAWDYYNAIGWQGADGEGTPIIVLKDFCDQDHNPVDNAAFAGKFYGWQVFLSSPVNDLAQCLDVCAHEFTHCVTDTVMTFSPYMNDNGAINEAISDIQGNLCEMMAGATEDLTWLLGENSLEPVRSMSDPNLFQQPRYSWDVYYREKVTEPTDINDYGGVHSNSSLLNRVAYLLCTDGGMTLEEARVYWFAADCAMVPGTDYAQLKELLPWVMKITGMNRYQEALAKAMEAVRLGDPGLPDTVDADKALLRLKLPDNDVFSNGKWILQTVSFNPEKLAEKIALLARNLKNGDLEGYPQLIRELAGAAGTDAETAQAGDESPGFPEILLEVLFEAASGSMETEPPEDDSMVREFLDWINLEIRELFHSDTGSAGEDGRTILLMSRPGLTVPFLMYVSVKPGGAGIDEMKYVCFLNGRWFDVTGFMALLEGKPDLREIAASLAESELLPELMKAILGIESKEDLLNVLALNVKGGGICEIPAEGLEQISLDTVIRDALMAENPETVNKKTRPKLP